MTASALNRIVGALETALLGIDGTSPYSQRVATVVMDAANQANLPQRPCLILNLTRTLYASGAKGPPSGGMLDRRMGFLLEGYVDAPQPAARKVAVTELLADVELALLADHSLGNLAMDLILVGVEFLAALERPDTAGFILEGEVWFRTPHNDPYAVG